MAKSFYDFDYIIELSEERLNECNSNYQQIFGSITNVILIYSALGIFITTLAQHVIDRDIQGWPFYGCFVIFSILLITSIFFFVRLLAPVEIAYLDPPAKYYDTFKPLIERIYPGAANRQAVDNSLKASYILEINE